MLKKENKGSWKILPQDNSPPLVHSFAANPIARVRAEYPIILPLIQQIQLSSHTYRLLGPIGQRSSIWNTNNKKLPFIIISRRATCYHYFFTFCCSQQGLSLKKWNEKVVMITIKIIINNFQQLLTIILHFTFGGGMEAWRGEVSCPR